MVASPATEYANPITVPAGTPGPLPGQRASMNGLNTWEFLSSEVPVAIGPTGGVRENMPREFVSLANDTTLSNAGLVLCAAFDLVAGDIVAKLGFGIGTTAGNTLTHQWAALLDSTLTVKAVSADGTNGAIAANAEFQFTMGAPFTVPATARYYAAISISATTAPSLLSKVDGGVSVATLAPVLGGTAGTQVAPPALAAQLASGTLTPVAARFWCRAL